MKTKFSVIIIILLSFLFAGSSIADESKTPIQNSDNASQEIQLLHAQLKATKEYQEQFISIIQWSLSAVLAMALGLAAFNWYTSKLSYDRDIKSLRVENKSFHNDLSLQIKEELTKSSAKLLGELETREKSIKSAAVNAIKPDLDALNSKISSQKRTLLNLEYDFKEQQAINAVENKRYSWAIREYCYLLKISVRQGSAHYQVGDILDEIGDLLVKPEISLSADDVTDAISALNSLPEKYKNAANNLVPKINKAHV